jgi:hypothetical protein
VLLLVYGSNGALAETRAESAAREFTLAIARHDTKGVIDAVFPAGSIEPADVEAVASALFPKGQPYVTLVRTITSEVERLTGSIACRPPYGRATVVPIEALIGREATGREVIILLLLGKAETHYEGEVWYGRSSRETERVMRLESLPQQSTGMFALPEPRIDSLEKALGAECYDLDTTLLRSERYLITVVDLVAVRDVQGGPRTPIRVLLDARAKVLRWNVMQENPERSGDTSNEPHDRGTSLQELLKKRLRTLATNGAKAFKTLRAYASDDRTYYDAGDLAEVMLHLNAETLRSMPEPELQALRVWTIREIATAPAYTTLEVRVAITGGTKLLRAVAQPTLNAVQEHWTGIIDRLSTLPDLAPDLTIISTPNEAMFFLAIQSEPGHPGTTTQTVKNVYRGLYQLQVTKHGHKTCLYQVDLVNDPRSTVNCHLVAADATESSFCRQE